MASCFCPCVFVCLCYPFDLVFLLLWRFLCEMEKSKTTTKGTRIQTTIAMDHYRCLIVYPRFVNFFLFMDCTSKDPFFLLRSNRKKWLLKNQQEREVQRKKGKRERKRQRNHPNRDLSREKEQQKRVEI